MSGETATVTVEHLAWRHYACLHDGQGPAALLGSGDTLEEAKQSWIKRLDREGYVFKVTSHLAPNHWTICMRKIAAAMLCIALCSSVKAQLPSVPNNVQILPRSPDELLAACKAGTLQAHQVTVVRRQDGTADASIVFGLLGPGGFVVSDGNSRLAAPTCRAYEVQGK